MACQLVDQGIAVQIFDNVIVPIPTTVVLHNHAQYHLEWPGIYRDNRYDIVITVIVVLHTQPYLALTLVLPDTHFHMETIGDLHDRVQVITRQVLRLLLQQLVDRYILVALLPEFPHDGFAYLFCQA